MAVLRADVIVVLGCRVADGGAPSAALARRVGLAVRALKEQVARTVLASGGRLWRGVSEAACIQQALLAAGVAEAQIQLELCSLTTLENAYYCARWMRQQGLSSALVCSCPWHLRRARRSFESFGIEAQGVPSSWYEPQTTPVGRNLRERVTEVFDRGLLNLLSAAEPAARRPPR